MGLGGLRCRAEKTARSKSRCTKTEKVARPFFSGSLMSDELCALFGFTSADRNAASARELVDSWKADRTCLKTMTGSSVTFQSGAQISVCF